MSKNHLQDNEKELLNNLLVLLQQKKVDKELEELLLKYLGPALKNATTKEKVTIGDYVKATFDGKTELELKLLEQKLSLYERIKSLLFYVALISSPLLFGFFGLFFGEMKGVLIALFYLFFIFPLSFPFLMSVYRAYAEDRKNREKTKINISENLEDLAILKEKIKALQVELKQTEIKR